MTFKIRALLGVVSAAISACAISIPLKMNSNSTHNRSKRSIEIGGGRQLNKDSNQMKLTDIEPEILTKNEHFLKTDEEDIDDDFMPYQDLGNNINGQYTYIQKTNDPYGEGRDLPWSDQLKKIIQSSEDTDMQGTIDSKDGRLCEQEQSNQTVFCGFLELRDKENHRYKVRISLSDGNQGLITVVSPTNEDGIEVFDQDDQVWEENPEIDFEDLSTFREPISDGEDIDAVSFTSEE